MIYTTSFKRTSVGGVFSLVFLKEGLSSQPLSSSLSCCLNSATTQSPSLPCFNEC